MLKFIITCIAFDLYPGVNFFYVGNITIANGLLAGLHVSLGMAVCDLLSGFFAVFGLLKAMEMHPTIKIVMRIFGCIYFLYLAISNFLSSFKEDKITSNKKEKKINNFVLRGFLIAITNPGIVMGDALVILQFVGHLCFLKQVGYILLFGLISFLCFAFVSFVFNHKKIRQKFVQKDFYLKRFSSIVMAFIFYFIFRDLVSDLKHLFF